MIKKSIACFVVFVFFVAYGLNVYAVEAKDYVMQSEFDVIIKEYSESASQKNQQIEDLINENENNQQRIEDLHSLYVTWTTIIFFLIALFGVILPILLPFILIKSNKKSINDLKRKIDLQIKTEREKALLLNNALALSSTGNYSAAVECFMQLEKSYPEDKIIKLYLANTLFNMYSSQLESASECGSEYELAVREMAEENWSIIISAIEKYIESFNDDNVPNDDLRNKIRIGNIFPSSYIHEVTYMISWLFGIREYNFNEFILVCKKALRFIEKELDFEDKNEIFDMNQTDVFVMLYKQINYMVARSYYDIKNIQAKDQLDWTIKLYSADEFSQSDSELKECKVLVAEYE